MAAVEAVSPATEQMQQQPEDEKHDMAQMEITVKEAEGIKVLATLGCMIAVMPKCVPFLLSNPWQQADAPLVPIPCLSVHIG